VTQTRAFFPMTNFAFLEHETMALFTAQFSRLGDVLEFRMSLFSNVAKLVEAEDVISAEALTNPFQTRSMRNMS
jgi:hypothetical protein